MKFEDRLAKAIDEIMHYQTADDGWINMRELAVTLITQGVVADPAEHQRDLEAIMAKQVRDADRWRDEYVTTTEDPARQNPGLIAAIIDPQPDWEDDVPTWRRRVTDWKEIHRAQ